MPSTFEVKNGGSVYFLTAPYFAGGTGTYLLDINITRDVAGIQDIADSDNFKVYPNPATNQVNIDLTGNIEIDEVTMYDMAGKEILKVAVSGRLQKHVNIPLDGVRTGAYFLVIKSENEKWQTKILKTR